MSTRRDRRLWNIEALRHRLDRELTVEARLRATFEYRVEGDETTSDCNQCEWQLTGTLETVRIESVAHLDDAHGLIATA
jgi:hypothetical protein